MTASKADYEVGRGRPPKEYRFKPGQSGNPKGRPKRRRNMKTEIKEAIDKKRVKVRQDNKEEYVSLTAANVLAHGLKGAQGDVRSSQLFFNSLSKLGVLEEDDVGNTLQACAPVQSNSARQTDTLFENLREDLLSRDEQVELVRIADLIDLGGDITALSTSDFERLKYLVNKGRSKDITPH